MGPPEFIAGSPPRPRVPSTVAGPNVEASQKVMLVQPTLGEPPKMGTLSIPLRTKLIEPVNALQEPKPLPPQLARLQRNVHDQILSALRGSVGGVKDGCRTQETREQGSDNDVKGSSDAVARVLHEIVDVSRNNHSP